MKERICGNCNQYEPYPLLNRIIQNFLRTLKGIKYCKVKGKCIYSSCGYYISVYENEGGCDFWEDKK